jgi:hypothetical protein
VQPPLKTGLLKSALLGGIAAGLALQGSGPSLAEPASGTEPSSLSASLAQIGPKIGSKIACGAKGCAYDTDDPPVVVKTVSAGG